MKIDFTLNGEAVTFDAEPNESVFRMLRQGQRVQFDLDEHGRATRLRLGSEVDMGTPDL